MPLPTKLQRLLQLRRAMRLVWQSTPGWTLFNLLLLVLRAILPLASLYLMKLIVDGVTLALRASHPDFKPVLWLIILMGGVSLAGVIANTLAALVGENQGQAVTDHIQSLIHAKSVEVDLEYYENPAYYDTLHRAQQEAPYRPVRILSGLLQVGQSSLALVALIGLLLSLHWIVAGVLLLAALPGLFVRLHDSQRLYAWQRERTTAERKAWYIQWVLTSGEHAKEVRQFDLGSLFIQRFRALRSRLREERLRLAKHRSFSELITQSASTLAIYGALAYIAWRTVEGGLTLGELVMYYQAFQRGQSYLTEILGGLATLYEDSLFITNLYEFLDLKPRIVSPSSPSLVPASLREGIFFDHVRFGYPGEEQPVLDDVSMEIHPGEHIALVGANGAGKTTLVKLLCRLYDPSAGRILLDGMDLRAFETAALRRQISVLFQDYAHYQLSARENIWLGESSQSPNEERIRAAAKSAGADKLIEGLPHGYDTILGNWFDEGHELSIGQWQKIALARVFLREAQILVLDEPTSALDAAAEHEVIQKFRQLAAGCTTILISHRFSTVRMAERIFFLSKGKIIESGSHEELLQQAGEYARLFKLQAGNYR
jgi:ATP-binding cassette, subfamily B, bacterial